MLLFWCYCLSSLVEQDSSTQELVSKTPQLVDKFLFVIHCACRGCPLGCTQHSLFSSQLAAITLFYCTFNVKSAQSFVDCGALAKMAQITTSLFVNKEDYDTPLRWEIRARCRYCELKKRRRTSFNILSDHYPSAQLVLWKIEIMCFNMLQLFSLPSSCALFSVYDSTVSPSSPKK